MRLLIFEGKFGHVKENIHEGLIAFCHFEAEDNKKTTLKASKKLRSLTKKNLILVPFAHLFEKTTPKEKARKLFEELIRDCEKLKNKDIIIIPFGIKKEFFLYAPARDSAVRFMKF